MTAKSIAALMLALVLCGCSDKSLTNQQLIDQSNWCKARHWDAEYIYDFWSDAPIKIVCVDPAQVYRLAPGRYEK